MVYVFRWFLENIKQSGYFLPIISLWLFLTALLNSILSMLQLEKLRPPLTAQGPGNALPGLPLPAQMTTVLKRLLQTTTMDLGPKGLQVYSWGPGSHSSQPSLVTLQGFKESPRGSAHASGKWRQWCPPYRTGVGTVCANTFRPQPGDH